MKDLNIPIVGAVIIFLIFAALAAFSETIDQQNAAMYELAVYAEEWNLQWYAGRDRVGAPWTAELSKMTCTTARDRTEVCQHTFWTEANFSELSVAVTQAEQDFEKRPDGSYRDNGGK